MSIKGSIKGKKALLVGVNYYDDSKLSDLRFAVNDVSSLFKILTDPTRGGFTEDNCLLLCDKNENQRIPTRSNMMSLVQSLSQNANSNEYLLFFFSGHGIEEEGKSYLLPSDAKINVLRDTAVSIDWVKNTLQDSKARAKVLILDACHAGAMKGKSGSGTMTKGMQNSLFPTPEGFAVLSSCKMNEVSYEMPEKKHGVFSYFLVEGLQGSADYDFDGHITISDASRYTADRTNDWAYAKGVQQTPNMECRVVGDLLLIDVPSPKKQEAPKVKKISGDLQYLEVPIHTIELNTPKQFSKDKQEESGVSDPCGKFCTYLLKLFNLHEIKFKDHEYVFPLGVFNSEHLSLKYNPKSIAKIEEVLLQFYRIIKHAKTVYYTSRNPFDCGELARMVKEQKLRPIFYDPKILDSKSEYPQQFLEVSTNPIGSRSKKLLLRFFPDISAIRDDSQRLSAIIIFPKGQFDEEVIEIVKPSKFLRFTGNVWKSSQSSTMKS